MFNYLLLSLRYIGGNRRRRGRFFHITLDLVRQGPAAAFDAVHELLGADLFRWKRHAHLRVFSADAEEPVGTEVREQREGDQRLRPRGPLQGYTI